MSDALAEKWDTSRWHNLEDMSPSQDPINWLWCPKALGDYAVARSSLELRLLIGKIEYPRAGMPLRMALPSREVIVFEYNPLDFKSTFSQIVNMRLETFKHRDWPRPCYAARIDSAADLKRYLKEYPNAADASFDR